MKNIILAAAIMLATATACTRTGPTSPASNNVSSLGSGQDDTTGNHSTAGIPPAVVASFKARYPSATGAEYEKEVENGVETYKVQFFLGSTQWIAFFQPDGTFISDRIK